MTTDDEVWEPVETAQYMKVPVQTLYGWRHSKRGPPSHKVGRHIRYFRREVEEWMRQQ